MSVECGGFERGFRDGVWDRYDDDHGNRHACSVLTSPTGFCRTVGEGSAPSYTLRCERDHPGWIDGDGSTWAITLPGGLTSEEASDFVETFLKDLQDAAGLGVTVGSAVTDGGGTTAGLTLTSTFNGNFTFTLPTLFDLLVEGPESFTVAALNAAVERGFRNGVLDRYDDDHRYRHAGSVSDVSDGFFPDGRGRFGAELHACDRERDHPGWIDGDGDLAMTLPGGLTGAEASDFVETFLKDLQDAAGLGVTGIGGDEWQRHDGWTDAYLDV